MFLFSKKSTPAMGFAQWRPKFLSRSERRQLSVENLPVRSTRLRVVGAVLLFPVYLYMLWIGTHIFLLYTASEMFQWICIKILLLLKIYIFN